MKNYNFRQFAKTKIILTFCLLQISFSISAQQVVGRLFDNVRGITTLLYDNGYFAVEGNPAIHGYVTRDPSGFNYLMVQAKNPFVNAYYINWNNQFVEVDKFLGVRVIGYWKLHSAMVNLLSMPKAKKPM
jgi:hypothetical protein